MTSTRTPITAIYRTGFRSQYRVVLACGHKFIMPKTEVSRRQLFIAKPYDCPNCKGGTK
jgi:hypothetical protein